MRGRARASKSARWRFSDFVAWIAQSAIQVQELPLRELEASARFGLAVFLALDHARVAGDEAAALEHATQFRFVSDQRLGYAVAHRTGLAGQSAARHRADHVVLALAVGGDQRLLDQH